jgi:hypothetical protein
VYEVLNNKRVGYLIAKMPISSRWPILLVCVNDEINQGFITEIRARCLLYTDNRTESEMGKIPVKFLRTFLGIVWRYYLEIIETD